MSKERKLERYDNNFFGWHTFQTLVISIIFGFLSVDPVYTGFDFVGAGLFLGICYFMLLMMIAMEFYQRDVREQRKAMREKRIRRKRAEKAKKIKIVA